MPGNYQATLTGPWQSSEEVPLEVAEVYQEGSADKVFHAQVPSKPE